MNKGKIARLVGFVGALGISAVLVSTAVTGTGAYFTDSHSGNLTGTAGSLKIDTDGTSVNFTGLNPGEDKSQTITYTVTGGSTTNADIWLVFAANSAAYGAFTGANGVSYGSATEVPVTTGGLGGFGHFKIASDQGYGFESYNLQLPSQAAANTAYSTGNAQGTCVVAANGTGGGTGKAVGASNNPVLTSAPLCGVPAAIQLASNITPGHPDTAVLTFGLTGRVTTGGGTWANVPFTIVATQPGIRPDAGNF